MTFHPRMESRIEGITVVDPLRCRAWKGAVADLWRVDCTDGARGEYVSPHPRLFVALHGLEAGGIALTAEGAVEAGRMAAGRPISFVPAGLRVSAEVQDIRRFAHLDIHFDVGTLRVHLRGGIDPVRLETPRLGFAEPRLLALAGLLAGDLASETPAGDAYGEGIVLAIFALLAGRTAPAARRQAGLAPASLHRITGFLRENALRGVRMEEVARISGLSTSHLAHAFKASTGKTVQGWHAEARLGRVQAMLLLPDASLPQVAAAAGFADQAHLTRVFRRLTGTTPAAWRRTHVAQVP